MSIKRTATIACDRCGETCTREMLPDEGPLSTVMLPPSWYQVRVGREHILCKSCMDGLREWIKPN